jgi:nicotinate phosphoribosyltransferase
MQWAIMNKFPDAKVEYKFFNRGLDEFPPGFGKALTKEIQKLSQLQLTVEEEQFLIRKTPFLPQLYIDFLKGFRYSPDEVQVTQMGKKLNIQIKGYWYRTVLWEVKLLSLISELFFNKTKQKPKFSGKVLREMNTSKIEKMLLHKAHISDFGTRRRYSFDNQDKLVKCFSNEKYKDVFMGTSNLYFAFKYNLSPIGTHAHEWFMFNAAKYGYIMANKMALDNWSDVYHGDLGIALTDTFTSKVFFKIFDKKMARLFDGVRHDSGDPFEFAQTVIKHYESLDIDPKSKALIFSDNLNIEKALRIHKLFSDKIKVRFGIGTFLTNDVGVKALSIVIKMTRACIHGEWFNTIKLSDDLGKETGDLNEIRKSKETLYLN